jgi:hypothetical protein
MNKKKLTNEELDGAARELFRATRVSADEIERIVASPMLFDSIKHRIQIDRPRQKTGFFERWAGLPVLNWNHAVAAFAIAVVFLAGTVAILVAVKRNPTMPQQARDTKLDAPVNTSGRVGGNVPAPEPETGPQPTGIVPVSYKKGPVKPGKAAVKHAPARQNQPPRFEAEGDFYPVTFAGGIEDMSGGGQIVRTEIPRSSLFAMGVDIPLESVNEKVKTDLLIGPDGVVRGVRIVK